MTVAISIQLLTYAAIMQHTFLMKPSRTSEQAVLRLARQHPLLRARDLARAGLPTIALTRLVTAGKLERVARGVYSLPIKRSVSIARLLKWRFASLAG